MAIDTEDKRRSVVQIIPIPDNLINAGDREQVAGLYRGISASPPPLGKLSRYAPLNGLGGQGQQAWNVM